MFRVPEALARSLTQKCQIVRRLWWELEKNTLMALNYSCKRTCERESVCARVMLNVAIPYIHIPIWFVFYNPIAFCCFMIHTVRMHNAKWFWRIIPIFVLYGLMYLKHSIQRGYVASNENTQIHTANAQGTQYTSNWYNWQSWKQSHANVSLHTIRICQMMSHNCNP